jgi:heme oxygenase
MSTKSLESESANIIRTIAANKVPGSLSMALDGTLKKGHDMKIFGAGTVAALANKDRYARFTSSMLAVYEAMESELDKATPENSPAVHHVWKEHSHILRRTSSLKADLNDVSATRFTSAATEEYVQGIQAAGLSDRELGGGRMLGHLYCRYFADLFGGSMLGRPTQLALALADGTPRHYMFDLPSARREYIESVYHSLNEGQKRLPSGEFDKVVNESLLAFGYNQKVYGEEALLADTMHGLCNVCTGYLGSFMKTAKQS